MDAFYSICSCCGGSESDSDSSKPKGSYTGDKDLLRGCRHGYGTYFYENGDIYQGGWQQNKKHGHGEYRYCDGRIYKGYFDNDRYIGSNPPMIPSVVTSPGEKSALPLTQEYILSKERPMKLKHEKKSLRSSMGQGAKKIKEKFGPKKKKQVHGVDERDYAYNDGFSSEREILTKSQTPISYDSFPEQNDRELLIARQRERERQDREREASIKKHRMLVANMKKKYNIQERISPGTVA